MAVTATQLTSGGSDTNTESYTTASISPSGNKLIIVAVYTRRTAGSTAPTLTGNGLTYVNFVSETESTGTILRMTLYRAMGASPSAGAITIDFGADTMEHCEWIVTEFDNVDTGGTNGSAAIVQSLGGRDEGTNTGLTITLAAFGDASNAAYGAVRAGNAITPGTDFIELAEVTAATEAPNVQAEWKDVADTTVDWSWASTGSFAIGAAIEIKAGAASGPANLKSLNTNAAANIKSYNSNLVANIKSINTNA